VEVNKRILAYHLSRLKDKNPEVRLKTIHELRLLGDPDALEALQSLYENDSNREVRRAAQEAGRIIFLKQQAGR